MNRKSWKMAVVAVLSAFLLSVEVLAQEGDEIRLDETGTVTLTSQEAAGAGVSSLQIGLRVDSAEGEKVEFIFAESNAKIREFRYDGEARQWNLYLAGTEALFAKGSNTLTLGRVVVLKGNGEAATATVNVPENSAWYVYGTELRSIEALKLPQPVVINAQDTDPPEEDDDGEDDASQGTDVGSGTTPGAAGNGSQGTTGSGNQGTAGSGSQGTTGSGNGTAGSGSQGTGSGTGTAGTGSQGTGSGTGSQGTTGSGNGAAGTGNQGTTGSGNGAAGSGSQGTTGSGSGTAGSGSQGTTGSESQGTAGTGSQGTTGSGSQGTTGNGSGAAGTGSQGTTGSGSQGNQSISSTAPPSSGVRPANAEAAGTGSEKKAAGIDWGIVLIILGALFAAAFGVLAAMLTVKVITRRR